MIRIATYYAAFACLGLSLVDGAELPVVGGESGQALVSRLEPLLKVLAQVDPQQATVLKSRIDQAGQSASNEADRFSRIEDALDSSCLLGVNINPESRVKVSAGPADLKLRSDEPRWFLVKVHNMAGVTAPLRVFSPQSLAEDENETPQRWLRVAMVNPRPMRLELSGDLVEYRLIRLETEAVGDRSALLAMDVGQGTADIGFRNDVLLTFRCTTISE